MVMKYSSVCLVALIVFCSLCEGQWRQFYRPSAHPYPAPRAPLTKPNPPAPVDSQQSTQPSKPLIWQYPGPPQPEIIPVGPSTVKIPVAAASVAVTCNETNAHVEVMEDLFGNGLLINPTDLTLGNCGASAEDNVTNVLIFDVELQACGSTLSMTNDSIIYSFILHYNPHTVSNIPVLRSSSAAVLVQCHYPRIHNVSSHPVNPYWIPFAGVRVGQEFLYFSMNLMTDTWDYLRPNNQYYMGDVIRIQVSVMQYFHAPLRVYVDSCIATTSPDTSSSPSYVFIDHGCMLDGMLTGSVSQFMPRTADNKLQFQLEAFHFQGAPSGILYITCHLIATLSSDPVDSDYRACSYINGWKEASGVNSACSSCYSGGSSPPGSGTGSSAAGSGATSSPGVGYGPTGSFGVGVGASVPSYGPGPSVPAGVGVGASVPSYGPGPSVPAGAGVGASVPSYGPGPSVPAGAGVGASVPSYGPGPSVPAGAGVGASVPSYGPGPSVPAGAGVGASVPSYGPGPSVPAGAGVGAFVPSYGPGPSVPAGAGVGASVPSYGPGPSVPADAGTGVYVPLSYYPGSSGYSGPGFGTYVPLGYDTGRTVGFDFESPGPLSQGTGPTSFLGAGFPVPSPPSAGLGATGSSGSGFGVTGSFGNFGTVPHFPPFFKGRKARDVSHNEVFEWEAQICMGPIRIQERPV